MANSSLWKRTLSGLVLVVVVVEMTVINDFTFYLLWSVVGVLLLAEFYGLLRKYGQPVWNAGAPRKGSPLAGRRKAAWYGLGTLYIGLAIAVIMCLEPMLVVTLLTLVWANDTGAYLVGTAIGRHKMAPSVSPNKSWEGFAGGLLFAAAVALVWYGLYWQNDAQAMVSIWGEGPLLRLLWLGLGLTTALAATGGDLIESKFKRRLGIKDSGNIIPGHGGILDRFDALLLAAPVATAYILLTGLL